jgi:hypothetical protein
VEAVSVIELPQKNTSDDAKVRSRRDWFWIRRAQRRVALSRRRLDSRDDR